MTEKEEAFRLRVLALHGVPRVGKDTVGTWLCEKHGFVRAAFATHLKAAVAAMFDKDADAMEVFKDTPRDDLALFHCHDGEYRAFVVGLGEDLYTPRTFRYHLKMYGTEYMQRKDPTRWVRTMVEFLKITTAPVVITDMRTYEDLREYSAIRAYCAMAGRPFAVWEIQRQGLEAPDDHPSNRRLPGYAIDATIHNKTGLIADTKVSVDALHKVWEDQNR